MAGRGERRVLGAARLTFSVGPRRSSEPPRLPGGRPPLELPGPVPEQGLGRGNLFVGLEFLNFPGLRSERNVGSV